MSEWRKTSHAVGIVERTQSLSFKEKARALNRASSKFHSKNPFFMVLMQPSYVFSDYKMVTFNSAKATFHGLC